MLQAKIESAKSDADMLQEEVDRLKAEVTEWESDFRRQNGHKPTERDRSASAAERYASLDEVTHATNKLRAQVLALEALRRGDIPAPPKHEKQVIEIKETEVTTVEVRVVHSKYMNSDAVTDM